MNIQSGNQSVRLVSWNCITKQMTTVPVRNTANGYSFLTSLLPLRNVFSYKRQNWFEKKLLSWWMNLILEVKYLLLNWNTLRQLEKYVCYDSGWAPAGFQTVFHVESGWFVGSWTAVWMMTQFVSQWTDMGLGVVCLICEPDIGRHAGAQDPFKTVPLLSCDSPVTSEGI